MVTLTSFKYQRKTIEEEGGTLISHQVFLYVCTCACVYIFESVCVSLSVFVCVFPF